MDSPTSGRPDGDRPASRRLAACLTRPMVRICNDFQIARRAGCFGPDLARHTNNSSTLHNRPDPPHQVVTGNPSG